MEKLDSEDIEQIELILELEPTNISEAHMQQYVKLLYEWYNNNLQFSE